MYKLTDVKVNGIIFLYFVENCHVVLHSQNPFGVISFLFYKLKISPPFLRISYLTQVGLELAAILPHLSNAEITNVYHYAQLKEILSSNAERIKRL